MTERTDPSSRPVPAAEPPPRDLSLFRAMMRSIPDPVWLKDAAGRYLACNRTFERLVGAPEDRIIGRTDHDLSLPERADIFRRQDLEALAAGRPTTSEQWLEFTDGGYRGLFETVKTPMYDASGELLGVLGIARDISELHAARRRAEQGERRLEMVLNAANEGIWDWDLRTNTVAHNAEWSRLLGITDGRLSRPFDEFTAMVHPDDRERVAAAVRDSFKTGQHSRREHRMVRADGRVIWVLNHGAVVERDTDGRVACLAGSIADITARKETEIALCESEQRFRAMAENSADGIWVIGVDGRSVYSNRVVERILGLPAGAKVDDDPFALLHPDDAKNYVDTLAQCVAGRRGWKDVVLRWWSPAAGSYVSFESSAAPLFDAAGRLEGFIGIDRDISARRAAEIALRESEEHYRRISELTSDVIFSCHRGADGQFRIDWCAGNAGAVFGFGNDELLARGCWRCSVVAEDQPQFERNITGLRPGQSSDFVVRIVHADGSTHWLHSVARVEDDPAGHGEHRLHGACQDITARHAAESARRESEQRYRALFAGSGDGIFVTCDNRVVDCNESAARIFRCRREELIGRPIAALSPERQPDGSLSAEAVPQRSSRAGAQGIFEWRHLRPDGSTFDAEINLTAVGIEGETHIIGILRDITERKQAEAEIEFLAHHDALTGLPNRVLLRDRYAHARAVAERNGTSAALLFIDLDNFKTVNDSLGHAAGDELLKAVVARLTQCVRDTDTVSRQGGDEFIVLLGDMSDPAAAERVAGEILLRLAEPFTLGSHVVNSGGSIGIALHPGDGDDFDTLLQKADTAMYNAKAAGRNTCRFFAEAMNARVRDHLQLQGHLRRALAEGGFRLAYQPKYSIDGSRITGLEALLRLSVPELGELSPGRFIPVAEDCGLIVPIGRWVLEAACRQLMAWRAAGIDAPPVSVNLSALQVHRPGLVGTVAEVLAATGLPPRLLEIELTESILLHDVDNTLATVRDLKRLGLTLAIDDFGTGYSSLAYLKRFAVDKLKIDQSFVRDIVSDPDDAAIVRAVIQLARSMRLGIVAEGVETGEQLAFLRAEGCEEIQGYLFSRPLPPAAVAALLRA